jgi:alpha-tubulin suppressor-like RCC1 family protein
MSDVEVYVPLSEYIPTDLWPSDLFAAEDSNFLDKIAYDGGIISGENDSIYARVALRVMTETTFQLPAGFAFVLGNGSVNAELQASAEGSHVTVQASVLNLRLPRSLFIPVVEEGDELKPDPDETHFVDIPLPLTLTVDQSFNVDLSWPGETEGTLNLPHCMLGESGIIISAEDIVLRLSSNEPLPDAAVQAGLTDDWHGVFIHEVAFFLPKGLGEAVPSDLKFQNCFIGTGGFSGGISADWNPAFSGTLPGIDFGLKQLALTFNQNTLTQSDILGTIILSFFDEPLDVGIAIDLAGGFLVKLDRPDGLLTLTKPGLLELTLDSINFSFEHDLFKATISGQVTPLFGHDQGLDWPTFRVNELSIDSKGNVHLEGGWLNLREQYHLNFHGFHMEITKLGFGKTEDGGKWIGFSGGLKLVDGMPAGASAEGLRITWYDDGTKPPSVTLNEVHIEFAVPNVLRFNGAVSYSGLLEIPTPAGIEKVYRFDGAIKLNLLALNMEVDATLVIGSASGPRGDYNFFATYVGVELPAGLALWSTGLALYGMAGLFAWQMEPNKGAPPNALHPDSRIDEGWYENVDGSPGWYKRGTPGVTDLRSKWDPHPGSLAFGVGATIGTLPDNGTSFSGKFLLAIVFPGPIVLLEGRGDLLRERAKLDQPPAVVREPLFRALAVMDNRIGTLTIGLDAQYKYGQGGELIDVHGGTEAFFDLHNADAWHLYLGEKEPRTRRIRANVFHLFEADAYVMLDAHQLALGAWVGYNEHWIFGPLSVTLEAWIDGNAIVSWKPVHFYGDLWLHGTAALAAFGFGIGLMVDARLAADVFDPFHVKGDFSVGIKLPWPFPSFNEDIALEWGPIPTPPPLPLPLKEIAIEQFKGTTSWPLPRGQWLLPNYDRGDGFLGSQVGGVEPPDLQTVPVVPLDCRPHLTFGRAVNDDALIGVNAQPLVPQYERIGDPARNEGPVVVRYGLMEVVLEKRVDGTSPHWQPVARKGTTPNAAGVRTLYGSWAPVPRMPSGDGQNVGQVKLWLWSKTPFDYTRHTSRAWDEWFTDRFRGYPCGPLLESCWNFEQVDPAQRLPNPWHYPQQPNLVFSGDGTGEMSVAVLNPPLEGLTHTLCFSALFHMSIDLPEPADVVKIVTRDAIPPFLVFFGYDAQGKKYGPFSGGTKDQSEVEIRGVNLTRIGTGYSVTAPTTPGGGGGGGTDDGGDMAWAWGLLPPFDPEFMDELRRVTPVQLSRLSGITEIAQAWGDWLALKFDGTVWAWGQDITTPVQIVGPGGVGFLTGVLAIAGGLAHSLALKSDGTVWAWGLNAFGQLGDGTTTARTTPVQVRDLSEVTALAGGLAHSLALKSDGTVWAWGRNEAGQLGDGTTTNHFTPVQVVGPGGAGFLTEMLAIAAAGDHSLALKSDGTVWAWGGNEAGQLGDGTTTNHFTPVQVVGPGGVGFLTGVLAIAAGTRALEGSIAHSLALRSDGTVWAWGPNEYGQLGDETTTNSTTPVQVSGLSSMTAIAAGGVGSLAIRGTRTLPSLTSVSRSSLSVGMQQVGTPSILTSGVAGAIGCAYVPTRNQLVFVEFGGKVSAIDLTTNLYTVLGEGYFQPEDIVVTADGTVAYVTERAGNLLRVDLTQATADRASAIVISYDMTAPQQIALDEAGQRVYVVEYASPGRLLRIDLSSGEQTVLASDLDYAVGLLMTPDHSVAYVSEQAGGGRISRIELSTGSRQMLLDSLVAPFFMRWADLDSTRLLLPLRDPYNRVILVDLAQTPVTTTLLADGVPFRPSSVAILPDDRFVVCSDSVVSAYDFQIGLLKICAVKGEEVLKHLIDELARWSQEGEVLEPYTTYRLKVATTLQATGEGELAGYYGGETLVEVAYFRTEGPPGLTELSVPVGHPSPDNFNSGLDDLTHYVRQTVPASISAAGATSPLPRGVYRAYDIGVEFNDNYVDLMYRLARRDLGIYLYDNNGPVRDAQGRLIVLSNRWGRTEQLTLTESEESWLAIVDESGCALIDPTVILHNRTVSASPEEQVLDVATLYEARLVPLLLHEDFSEDLTGWQVVGGSAAHWQVRGHKTLSGAAATATGVVVTLDGSPDLAGLDPAFDVILLARDTAQPSHRYRIMSFDPAATPRKVTVDGTPHLSGGSSAWEIPALGAVVQTSNLETLLVRGDPDWTDYRLSVYLRSPSDNTIGVVFRYRDSSQYYRFSMDRQNQYRRLVKVVSGNVTPLVEDNVVFNQNQDYLITVEAIGPSLRVYQDGALVFDVTDNALTRGRIGLYCAGNAGARFSDVRVDDFRAVAPVAYRFTFTTSLFANFFHHLHSFQDETWRATLAPTVNIAPWVAAAVPPTTPPLEAEARAYEALATQVLGTAAMQSPPEIQVSRVEREGQPLAFLVQSPEPIDWQRTDLQILRADRWALSPTLPGALKLTDVSFGTTQPNEESVTLLLRDATELTGQRLEYRTWLLDEPFAVLIPDRWTFVDEGDQQGPSQWAVTAGELRQTSPIFGGSTDASVPDKPGTSALAGDATWTDYCLRVHLVSDDPSGVIGVIFRYQDANNYYRFSMDQQHSYRRLIKKVAGVVTVLWQDAVPYTVGREYALTLECAGEQFRGSLDGVQIFTVRDSTLTAGRIGLYCWANTGARFAEVQVAAPAWAPYYTFGQEARLPAGTRIRVYAGGMADPAPEEPGVMRRFIGGQLRLPAQGAELRLATARGTGAHARGFRPANDYIPVAARVLRKADGTGLFIAVPASTPAGSQLTVGQYRLQLAYRRDNRATDPDSPVFSAAGNSAPEQVTVDIPWYVH